MPGKANVVPSLPPYSLNFHSELSGFSESEYCVYGHTLCTTLNSRTQAFPVTRRLMKTNKIALPHGFTMLARGLTQMEGVLADIAPSINMVEIAAARLKEQMWQNFDWKSEFKNTGKTLYKSAHRAIALPQQLARIIEEYERGQTRINLDMHSSDQLSASQTCQKYRDGIVGYGTSYKLKHSLHNRYEAKDSWNTGAWGVRIFICCDNCFIYYSKAFYFQKIISLNNTL